MATKKLYDLVAVTGTYKDKSGEDKKRYLNVGVVLENEHGPYMVLERWFSPAGIPGTDRVLISMFEPRQEGQAQGAAAPASTSEDIPF